MMGNRGVLHDDDRHVVRSFQVKRWIACVLHFQGRVRQVMTPHRYTELFFLDEAAGFSAGHRPCAECRRDDYNRFRELWEKAVGGPSDADSIDHRLHAERLDGEKKRTYCDELANLPDGTYVVLDGKVHLVWGTAIFEWSASGYTRRRPRGRRPVEVLTPPSVVKVFKAGYHPWIHPSAVRSAAES